MKPAGAINMQAHVSYNVIDDLKLEGTLSYGVSNTNQEIYFTRYLYVHQLRAEQTVQNDMCPIGGELRKSEVRNTNWMARVQANYAKNVGGEGKHNVSGSAGLELNSQRYDGFNITRRGYHRDRGKLFSSIPNTYTKYHSQFMISPKCFRVLSRKI